MIRVSVLYPKTEGASFDHEYYRTRHAPLCEQTWKPERLEIDRGIDGPYEAVLHVFFPSMEAVQAAMGSPGTKALTDDVANYTTISAVLQVSEVV